MARFIFTISFKTKSENKMWARFDILHALLSTLVTLEEELPIPFVGPNEYWYIAFEVETDDWGELKAHLYNTGFDITSILNVYTDEKYSVGRKSKRRRRKN